MNSISVGFVYFRTLDLIHLDAAWYSLSRQDFTGVNSVVFLDNNTDQSPEAIDEVLDRYPLPVPLTIINTKHGDPTKTQSWSVNTVVRRCEGPWIFFTRADYILAFDCVTRLRAMANEALVQNLRPFVSAWCWQMAYDSNAGNIDGHVDIEQYGWREGGMAALQKHPYAIRFHDTDQDAGVWLTHKDWFIEAGWMNEQMAGWGYQQSTFQRALHLRSKVTCMAVQDYLFAHQHHYAVRDFAQADREYRLHGGGM